MNNTRVVGVFLLSLTLLASACNSSKKAARHQTKVDTAVAQVPVVDTVKKVDTVAITTPAAVDSQALRQAAILEYKPLWSQYRDFNTFQGKAQMSYAADGESQDFTAHIRMVKDKAIWVSITALGGIVNVARALITPDSIQAIIYLQKEFVDMPTADAEKVLPTKLEFASLQNLIMGNPVVNVTQPVNYADLGAVLQFLFQEADKSQSLDYNKADQTLRSNQLSAMGKNQQMTVLLSNPSRTPERFPQARTLQVLNEGKRVIVTMDFKEFEFNNTVELPFAIPKSYKRKVMN